MSAKLSRGIIVLLLLLLITVPYLAGFGFNKAGQEFGGFLVNPIDGNSYLAKMQQGFRGEWKFRLSYTSEPGQGAYLFLFYLGLGHGARILGLPLIYVFHGARILAAAWLLLMIHQSLRYIFPEQRWKVLGYALAVFGSGLGWMAALAGGFTSDFWVAEAYPFLSMYTNPHFSLGLGLMIYALLPRNEERILGNVLAGIALGIVQPFGVAIISLVKIIQVALRIGEDRIPIRSVFRHPGVWAVSGFCLSGGLVLLYQFWAILSDPVLSQWHGQNITARPELLDLVISLSPCLVLALIGARKAWRSERGRVMVIWGAVCMVLAFIPWSLQRRFLTGIYFPLAIVSVFGLMVLSGSNLRRSRYVVILLFFLATPTNLIVVTSGMQAITANSQEIYLRPGLPETLAWIRDSTDEDVIVLADEKTGLLVPAWTGRRVIYGHPFETVQAASEQALIADLYGAGQTEAFYEAVLDERRISYVLIDKNDQGAFAAWLGENWVLAYQSEGQLIYSRD